MRAGQLFACNTPASEVEAQLFNGGVEGSYPTLLEFNYKKGVEVDTWEIISRSHDFELHVNGEITAWRSYQVGKGKRFAKVDLDAKYKHGTTQPSTGAIFVADVGKSKEDFQPKLEMRSRRKRQLKVDKAERTVARKKAKIDVSKAAKHKLDIAVAERVPITCRICDRHAKVTDMLKNTRWKVILASYRRRGTRPLRISPRRRQQCLSRRAQFQSRAILQEASKDGFSWVMVWRNFAL
jgi:hypothetical protein